MAWTKQQWTEALLNLEHTTNAPQVLAQPGGHIAVMGGHYDKGLMREFVQALMGGDWLEDDAKILGFATNEFGRWAVMLHEGKKHIGDEDGFECVIMPLVRSVLGIDPFGGPKCALRSPRAEVIFGEIIAGRRRAERAWDSDSLCAI